MASSHEDTPLLAHATAAHPRHVRGGQADVAKIDAAPSELTTAERTALFVGIFLVCCAYGLESLVRLTYQPYVTSSFSLHSYLSTINVIRNVVTVAVLPTAAKIADIFGRFEIIAAASACYVLGMAIESTASSVYAFCAGGIIYQIGYNGIILLVEVLVADFTSMKTRVLFGYLSSLPFVVNTWISGNVTAAVLSVTSWRWGIGMWCIIYPVATAPLLIVLYFIQRRASSSHERLASGAVSPQRRDSTKSTLHDQIDIVGLLVLVVAFSLILAPLTVAGGNVSRWSSPSILIPLIAGFVALVLFILWEWKGARVALVPFHLLSDRAVWAALAVRGLFNFAWSVQASFLYTILVVAFDFSTDTATRITSLFSFCSVLSGLLVGVVVCGTRRLKPVIVAGSCVFAFALSILLKYSGGASQTARTGMVTGQVVLGLAGALSSYTTQTSVQASGTQEHVAILTSLYLSCYSLGSAFGTCLAGAVWTQTLLPTLRVNLAFQSNSSLAEAIYESPFSVVQRYPVGTSARFAIIQSYQHVQRNLCVAALISSLPLIAFAVALRNPKLSEEREQEESRVIRLSSASTTEA